MNWIEAAKALIKRHEGFRKFPYKDKLGFLTIGYGHNLTTNGLSKREANFVFQQDFQTALTLARSITAAHDIDFRTLPEPVKEVLVDMSFNLGAKLFSFKTFLSLLKAGRLKDAAADLEGTRWFSQVKGRAKDDIKLLKEGSND